jgi:hypothetical protein
VNGADHWTKERALAMSEPHEVDVVTGSFGYTGQYITRRLLFFYDPEIRRQNRLTDVAMLLAFSYLGAVFGIAALGAVR